MQHHLTTSASAVHYPVAAFNSAAEFDSSNPTGGHPLKCGFFAPVTPLLRLLWAGWVGSRKARRFPVGRSVNPSSSVRPFDSGRGNLPATIGGQYHG